MGRWLLTLVFGVALAGTTMVFSTTAAAQSAKELYVAGKKAYDSGRYADAVKKWEVAYEKDPRPLLKYNIGLAYERLGRLQDAVDALDIYLNAKEGNRDYIAETRAKRLELQGRLDRTGFTIVGAPAGALISVDGKEWGMTPRPDPIRLPPGNHRLVLTREGFRPYRASVGVTAGAEVQVDIDMEALPEADPKEVAAAMAPPPKPAEFPVVPVALMGAGGAVLVGGIVLGSIATSKAADTVRGSSEADSLKTQALVADIMMGVGAAAAAAGLVLFLLDGDDDEPTPSAHIAPYFDSSQLGATATMRF